MLPMDMPNAPPQETPIALAQTAAPGATAQPDYLLDTCKEVPSVGSVLQGAAIYPSKRRLG